jgi:hypothetical protein
MGSGGRSGRREGIKLTRNKTVEDDVMGIQLRRL